MRLRRWTGRRKGGGGREEGEGESDSWLNATCTTAAYFSNGRFELSDRDGSPWLWVSFRGLDLANDACNKVGEKARVGTAKGGNTSWIDKGRRYAQQRDYFVIQSEWTWSLLWITENEKKEKKII